VFIVCSALDKPKNLVSWREILIHRHFIVILIFTCSVSVHVQALIEYLDKKKLIRMGSLTDN